MKAHHLAGREQARVDLSWQLEGTRVADSELEAAVRSILTSPRPAETSQVVDALLEVLLGSGSTRFISCKGEADRSAIRARITQAVAAERPLSFLTMWGAIKHYVRPEDQGVDGAELFASLRLMQLSSAIEAIYTPGALFHVIVEDFAVWYQDAYGYPAADQRRINAGATKYVEELRRLFWVTGGAMIIPHVLADVVDLDYRTCVERVQANCELIKAYWDAGPHESATAFARLEAAGWRGAVAPEARQHYLHRLHKLYPNEAPRDHVERISRYLATVLFYEQVRLLATVDETAIRLAFYKPAPGLPPERRAGRIHLRGLPRRFCSTAMPPWTCKGCMVQREGGPPSPRIESLSELFESGATVRHGWLDIGTHTGSCRVRLDLVARDGVVGPAIRLQQYGERIR